MLQFRGLGGLILLVVMGRQLRLVGVKSSLQSLKKVSAMVGVKVTILRYISDDPSPES